MNLDVVSAGVSGSAILDQRNEDHIIPPLPRTSRSDSREIVDDLSVELGDFAGIIQGGECVAEDTVSREVNLRSIHIVFLLLGGLQPQPLAKK